MNVIKTELEGVLIIEPRVFSDARGWFFESYHSERCAAAGLPRQFVQDNHSRSVQGTLRGLHYQLRRPQGKLVRVVRGSAFDVAVDIRRGSPTFGRWLAVTLSAENRREVYIPPGFAHGFCVPQEECELEYKCTDYHAPGDEYGIRWDDPVIGVQWPVRAPFLLEKDRRYAGLSADRPDLPEYQGAPR